MKDREILTLGEIRAIFEYGEDFDPIDVLMSIEGYSFSEIADIIEKLSENLHISSEYRQMFKDLVDGYKENPEAFEGTTFVEVMEEVDTNYNVYDVPVETIDNKQTTDSEGTTASSENSESIPVEEPVKEEPVVVPPVVPETEEAIPVTSVEQEPIVPETAPVVEATPTDTIPAAEQPIETLFEGEVEPYFAPEEQVFTAVSHQDIETQMEDLKKIAALKGINIIAGKLLPHEPAEIAIELTPDSKAYVDNLLLQLYDGDKKDNLDMHLIKDDETGKEYLQMKIDDKDLSSTQIQKYSLEMLEKVNEIVESTNKDKDYESLLPDRVKEMRALFHNDEKELPKDYDVHFVETTDGKTGESVVAVIAPDQAQAKAVAEDLDLEIGENLGAGAVEVKGPAADDFEHSKVVEFSKDPNFYTAATEPNLAGETPDLNTNYENNNSANAIGQVQDFLADSIEDERTISQLTIVDNGNNTLTVNMADTNGRNDTILIDDAKSFNTFVLPSIADTFSKDSEVSGSKTFEESGAVGYFAESDKNTRLIMSGSTEEVVDKVDNKIQANQQELANQQSKENTNSKVYNKSLGTHPSTTSQAANISLATVVAFSLVLLVGLAIVFIVFGG